MKTISIIVGVFIIALTALRFQTNFTTKNVNPTTYELSIAESELRWTGSWISPIKEGEKVHKHLKSTRHPGMKVNKHHVGTVELTEGVVKLHDTDDRDNSGQFTVDLTTINNTDLTGEMKDKLEGHLKSPEFFDVSQYAQAKVTLQNIKRDSAQVSIKVMGEQLEQTIPLVTFVQDDKMMLRGDFSIDMSSLNFALASPNPEKPEDGHIDPIIDFTMDATLKQKKQ